MRSTYYDFSSISSISSKKSLKIRWTRKAKSADAQRLEMVILMSPIDQTYLWTTEYKIHAEGNFKCCCLLKLDSWTSCNFVWRPRHDQNIKILRRSSSVRLNMRRSEAHISRSAMVDTCFPLLPTISARSSDVDKIVGGSNNLVAKQFMYDPTEEPWLLESSLVDLRGLTAEDKIVRLLNSNLVKSKSLIQSKLEDESENHTISSSDESSYQHQYLYENDQPVEEPWLLGSSLCLSTSGIDLNEESVEHEAKTDKHFYEDHQQAPDKSFPGVEGKTSESSSTSLNPISWSETHSEGTMSDVDEEASVPDSVTTVILINSSLCTMQRIAVLEDGKLVELLLEPVKNNVQCDSIYLGTVTKLLPTMSGAFVNIGIARNSLMEIKSNKKPFIFPPFRPHKKGKEVIASLVGELRENLGSIEEVIDNVKENKINFDSVQYDHDDYDEHDIEDDVDVTEVSKETFNGDVELDGDGHTVSKLPPIDLGYHGSYPSILEVVKECKETWAQVQKGTKVIVQVVKEGLGTKGPTLTAYPKLRSRFWILNTRSNKIGISKKISGLERTRLKVIAKTLLPPGFGLIVRTVAVGHSLEELKKDLDGLLSTWSSIVENAKSAALAADEGIEGAVPVILHRAMGQTLSVVQDYFNEKVKSMVVDSPRTYHEVTHYLQEIAPDLCDRVELYTKRTPLFDEYNLEEDLNNILSKRVSLSNGGYLVIEQTEALVSIDVNGGHCMLGDGTSQNEAVLEVNLAAGKQIARELRLRDIGGIIVVDFIDMPKESNRRLVYELVKKAVERDRSTLKVSELSRNGLMEITRKRVRPSVTFKVTEPCTCCYATGRVEASETLFSRIEHEICRLLAKMDDKADPGNPKSWPRFILKVDQYMSNYLTSGRRTKLALLSSSLKVWIMLKVARGFTRGAFELKPLADEKEYRNHQAAISMINKTSDVGTFVNTPKGKFSILPPKKWTSGGSK